MFYRISKTYYPTLICSLTTLLAAHFLSGCEVQILAKRTQPSKSSFTSTWSLIDPLFYTYDSTKIDLTSGSARLLSVDQTDDDNTSLGFAGGTHLGTAWDGTKLRLGNA